VLDGGEAQNLRDFLAEHGAGGSPRQGAPARGLARLLRRNPTEAERTLWQALVNDRRLAGLGFKRQVPIGPHVVDVVSFAERCVIDLVPADEGEAAAHARDAKRLWLKDHDYRVIGVRGEDVESNVAAVLDTIAGELSAL
jgi:tRNA/rRNA methyltransferase